MEGDELEGEVEEFFGSPGCFPMTFLDFIGSEGSGAGRCPPKPYLEVRVAKAALKSRCLPFSVECRGFTSVLPGSESGVGHAMNGKLILELRPAASR